MAGLIAAAIFLMTPMATGLVLGGRFGRLAFVACRSVEQYFQYPGWRVDWIRPIRMGADRECLGRFDAVYALAPVCRVSFDANQCPLVMGPSYGSCNSGHKCADHRPAGWAGGEAEPAPSTIRGAGSFGGDWFGYHRSIRWVGAFLPALVTHLLGPIQGGYFYVPWIITTMIGLLLTNIAISMVREVVANPEKADFTIRRSVGLAALVVIIVVVVCLLLARLVLAPLGQSFAVHGTPLLRWIGLAAPATAIISLFLGSCLVRRRPWPAFAVNLTTSAAIVGGVLLLGSDADISRVGMIYCIVQWVTATVISWPTFRALRALRDIRESQ